MAETHPCRPMTVYGASKLAGELYALSHGRSYGLPVSVVRPFNTYGPREPWGGLRAEVLPRFFLQLEAGRAPVIYGDGSQPRDFTYVADTVEGLVRAAECDALAGDVVRHFAATDRARELFGFEAPVDIGDGLVRSVAWFRARGIAVHAGAALADAPKW